MAQPRILVTGASGQLGQRVVDALLKTEPPEGIAVMVRRVEAGAPFAARGLAVRLADYKDPAALRSALSGIERLLLISSSEIGQRVAQHRNVIAAAAEAGVSLLAYTSVLHADRSSLGLAEEHRQTEAALAASGLPFALLRNGWYTENLTMGIAPALQYGVVLGSSGEGRFASAARADYAAAAAAVLTSPAVESGKIYELAGDTAYTKAEFAAEIARQAKQAVAYKDMPQPDFEAVLLQAGLPSPLASLIADSDAAAAKGALDDTSETLSRLIGRPTTPMAESVAAALNGGA